MSIPVKNMSKYKLLGHKLSEVFINKTLYTQGHEVI